MTSYHDTPPQPGVEPPFGPPLGPMLARSRDDLPTGDGWVYEPKWDGFRTIVFRDTRSAVLRSRNDRPLNRYFPEVEGLLADVLPPGCVVDGEIVMPSPGGLDFDALQLRLHPAASRVEMLARTSPASFVAFDLPAAGGNDLRGAGLGERLARLDEMLGAKRPEKTEEPAVAPGPRLYLTSRTSSRDEAARWFTELEGVGLDGVIAKRLDLPYTPGQRVMVKVKHKRTADCVVGGYRLSKSGDGVGSLLLGVYRDSVLQYVGHTSSFKAAQRRELLERLRPLEGGDSFGEGRSPGGPSRWAQMRETEWIPLRPELVCEVSYDYMQGQRFRHAATFLRWRDDKDPQDCTFAQLT